MLPRLSFDAITPIALLSACHFLGRWNGVFGSVMRNSYVYLFTFLGIVLTLTAISFLKPTRGTWRARLVVAIMVPYVLSVVSYLLMSAMFYFEHGKLFPLEMLVVSLFAPYMASSAWVISVCGVIWVVLDWYCVHSMDP